MSNFQASLEIPDLWFDFYVRFLPGITFIGILGFIIYGSFSVIYTNFAVFFIGSYLAGLLLNPISSWIANKMDYRLDEDGNLRDELLHNTNLNSHEVGVIHKMRGEVLFFIQMLLFYIILVVIYLSTENKFKFLIDKHEILTFLVIIIFLLLLIFGVCSSAKRRIDRIYRLTKMPGFYCTKYILTEKYHRSKRKGSGNV